MTNRCGGWSGSTRLSRGFLGLTGLVAVALVLTAIGCAGPRQAAEPLLTTEQQALNVESFDYVWTTIRDKHFDPELNGVDWAAIRDELRPTVEQAARMSQARAAMGDMIGRLGQSHFAIIPGTVYADLEMPAGKGARDGEAGIVTRVVDGHALVTKVIEGFPAGEAGIRTGWEIVRIGETELAPIMERIESSDLDPSIKRAIRTRSVMQRLSGAVGDTVQLALLNERGETVELELTLAQRRGNRVRFGHLPTMYVWSDAREVEPGVGYVAFSSFFDPVNLMKFFGDAVTRLIDADGLIIDLRGNPGGIGAMAMGMGGWLVSDDDQYLGTMTTRDSQVKFTLNPRLGSYAGPVAVLMDESSGSTSEIFAGGLKDIGRARIFGATSAGAALPSAIERLANGDGFQYAIANYVSAGGEELEGKGVIPDHEAGHTREALLEGRDLVVEAAVEWIRNQQ